MLSLVVLHSTSTAAKLNVLMIAVDDLRPDISGPYGQTQVKTPNMDRLAAMGTTFQRAHCQYALCGPSRAALLTGLRPDSSHIWSIGPYFRDNSALGKSIVTLPQAFKNAGYWTVGGGKVMHPGSSSGGPSKGEGGGDGGWPFTPNGTAKYPAAGSWSEPYFFCDQFYNGTFQSPAMQEWPGARAAGAGCVQSDECVACLTAAGTISKKGKISHSSAKCDASCYPDGAVADHAISLLNAAAADPVHKQPFFIATGFKRPHLGWMAPQSYFDMYNIADVKIAKHILPPSTMPKEAFSGNGELCGMSDAQCKDNVDGYTLLNTSQHATMRAAYYSVVSFMDAQLGRVLDALASNKLGEKTVIAFWGGESLLTLSLSPSLSLSALSVLFPCVLNLTLSLSLSNSLLSLLLLYPPPPRSRVSAWRARSMGKGHEL